MSPSSAAIPLLLEPPQSSPPSRNKGFLLALRVVAALLVALATGGFFYYLLVAMAQQAPLPPPPLGKGIVFSRIVVVVADKAPVSTQQRPRRLLRGRGGGLYPVTSPTNGGQLVSPGVPWPPNTIAEAQAKYPPNAVRMEQNGLVGQQRQDNRMQDDVYDHLRVYARLQRRAEDQALVARLQEELGSPAFVQLRSRVQDPSFQYQLQAGLYRRAGKYVRIEDRVQDPAFMADLQASLYRTSLRPGRPRHPEYSAQATAVETRPVRPSHVP